MSVYFPPKGARAISHGSVHPSPSVAPLYWGHEAPMNLSNLHDTDWAVFEDPWPDKFQRLTDQQAETTLSIVEAYKAGADLVLLDAPTGTGKTVIAEAVRRLLGARGLYLCTSTGLQQQFQRDFSYARVIQGRNQYPAAVHADRRCSECEISRSYHHCQLCEVSIGGGDGEDSSDLTRLRDTTCPYWIAKFTAYQAALACGNTAYFIREANGPGWFRGRDLVVVDEADELPDVISAYVHLELPRDALTRIGAPPLTAPHHMATADLLQWFAQVTPLVEKQVQLSRAAVLESQGSAREARVVRQRDEWMSRLQRIHMVMPLIADGRWVPAPPEKSYIFHPVYVAPYGPHRWWAHGSRWLLMSSTIIDPGGLLHELGWPGQDGSARAFSIDSTFPVDRRPLIPWPVTNMRAQQHDATDADSWGPSHDALDQIAIAITSIANEWPNVRILVHLYTKQNVEAVAGRIRDPAVQARVLRYTSMDDWKTGTRLAYLANPRSVLLSCALERGEDFPGDECRIQIVAKAPWGSLGDPRIRKRREANPEWYALEATRTLVQMTGRGMRSADDWCYTYLLDSGLRQLYRRAPAWWQKALVAP